MRIQLWSYNYDPEPTGIGPLSTAWAAAMRDRGHYVEVIAAHPHYPAPVTGPAIRPRREIRNGIPVLRLPLWPGRGTTIERVRQELTYTASLSCTAPLLGCPDVIVAVSPSFPALGPAMAAARLHGIPWVLWLQDILPDAATATGLLPEGRLIRALRRFELAAYRSARRIVVISDSFATNLREKGVPSARIVRIFNPATQPIQRCAVGDRTVDGRLVLTMGNVGHTQNLVHVVRAFQSSAALSELGARLLIAGDGVAADEVRGSIVTGRVNVTGVIPGHELQDYLNGAAVALVSQDYQGLDFNVPSKLMNFMAYGLPVVAAVRPDSEVARIVVESGGGWVTSGSDPDELASKLTVALTDGEERGRRGRRGLAFAADQFTPQAIAQQFESVLLSVLDGVPRTTQKQAPALAGTRWR